MLNVHHESHTIEYPAVSYAAATDEQKRLRSCEFY